MPKLTGLLWLVIALAASCNITSAAQEASAVKKQSLAIRAAGPVSDNYLEAFMELVDAKRLPKEDYPDLYQLTANQIISVLCGSFNPAYLKKLRELNNTLQLPEDPDAVIGQTAYQVNWPACIFVDTKPTFKYIVKPGDTASGIYKILTGAAGESHAVDQYFQTSGISNLDKIKPGQMLAPNHITLPTVVEASFTPDTLKTKLSTYPTSATVKISLDDWAPPPEEKAPQVPRFEIAAGKIQSAYPDGYEKPTECTDSSSSAEPFNSLRLSNAYKDSLEAVRILNMEQTFTRVAIADNGFFGANVISGKAIFGSHFPARFFMNDITGGAGIIGPITTSDRNIYPINYQNGKKRASIVSGHGTHIAGLILGGAEFQPYLSVFDRAGGAPWLQLWIINIGNGEATLFPNSTSELNQKLGMLNNGIINLSLEYEEPVGAQWNEVFLHLTENTNLFVVSAGNDGKSDVSDVPYYPAILGGTSQRNVISVAAHKSNGELAKFSNRGASSIDLAAPGCDLSSWLDDSANITKVSGTSQAAAIVTFTATLLRSLGNMAPIEIKNRLMISGDLLKTPFDSKSSPNPGEILSRSKLNAIRALYIFDDYVKYTSVEDGSVHEVLGQFLGMPNVNCAYPVTDENLWAVKASEDGLWLYKGRKAPLQVVQGPCLAAATKDAVLKIKVRAELNPEGVPIPLNDKPIREVKISELSQLVRASRPFRQSL